MEDVSAGVIYNTPLDSNEGDLSPHTSQTIYSSKTNENKMSDRLQWSFMNIEWMRLHKTSAPTYDWIITIQRNEMELNIVH